MEIRYFRDPDSGQPHIYGHNVSESEVAEAPRKPLEEFRGRRQSMVAHGQTITGRYLKVIFVPDVIGDGIFVVTAYDLSQHQLHALRRRLKRKPR